MQNVLKKRKPFVIAVVLVASVAAVAWKGQDNINRKSNADTVFATTGDTLEPRKRNIDKDEYRLTEIDDAMRDLDREMKRLGEEMRNLKLEKLNDLDKTLKASLAQVDFEKINREVRESMKKVDFDKIRLEVDRSLKEAEVNMKKIDLSKMDEKLKAMQEELKSENFKIKIDGEEIRKSVEEGMKHAKEGMEKAKVELKNYKDFTAALEKDGLIEKKKGFKIELKEGSLFINGKEQSKQTTDKYKQFYREKKNFNIVVDGDEKINL